MGHDDPSQGRGLNGPWRIVSGRWLRRLYSQRAPAIRLPPRHCRLVRMPVPSQSLMTKNPRRVFVRRSSRRARYSGTSTNPRSPSGSSAAQLPHPRCGHAAGAADPTFCGRDGNPESRRQPDIVATRPIVACHQSHSAGHRIHGCETRSEGGNFPRNRDACDQRRCAPTVALCDVLLGR